MQHVTRWKAAANLDLLLGLEHPPPRLERGSLSDVVNRCGVSVDARNTVSFKDTLYCNRQDSNHTGTQRRLADYYRFMLCKIPHLGALPTEEVSPSVVKEEVTGEEASPLPGNTPLLFRARGILTQISHPGAIGEELFFPWEFYPIPDVDDEESYVEPIRALTRETHSSGLLQISTENEDDFGTGAAGTTTVAEMVPGAATNNGGNGRLSLFVRLVPQFTGLYPGMAVGIAGEPFKRSASGVLTGVLVRQFILPSRPQFPWSIERALPMLQAKDSIPTRVHFCSGPFPRREISPILSTVTWNALSRGATLLIIGGPLVKEFEDWEKEVMMTVQKTFDELLSLYMYTIEETIEKYYAAYGNPPEEQRLKVVLVAHRDDVTQVPVLPTTMYGLEDGPDVWVRSNPCRISVNGIHFGICNEDVVGDMRERMVERWPTESGSLRRVVECIIQSRLYAPFYEFPAVKHDLKHLHTLRMEYLPDTNGAPVSESSALTWHALQSVGVASSGMVKEHDEGSGEWKKGNKREEEVKRDDFFDAEENAKHERKRMKQEVSMSSNGLLYPPSGESSVEWMPHIMFLPSTRPRFAVVTHRSVWDAASSQRREESTLDDTSAASGVLVVNQEIWSRRSAPQFELRVAEVTIPDSGRVMCHGASEVNGVSCGVIHFTVNTSTS